MRAPPTSDQKRKKPKVTSRPKGGRRSDIPWREIRTLYVEGEKVDMPDGTVQHRWPSIDNLAERFRIDPATIGIHSSKEQWVKQRADFQRAVEDEDRKRRAAAIVSTSDIWTEKSRAFMAICDRAVAEIDYAFRWYQEGHAERAAASRRRSPSRRPGGGDDVAQGNAAPEEHDTSTAPTPRSPMPPRDQKDLAAALSTTMTNARLLILGVQGNGPTPPTPGGPKETPDEGADLASTAGVAETVSEFMQFVAARNRTPQKDTP